ncbi:MAG: tRNA (N(6)-L-threonylcarbamoyladenosine(37)-C(2))-methylthiotransferase MtaB [Rhodospirillales bacterium]|nr:tRNA (N(6)-L-threonylcarbamoyladenosine(37)-C(2))-methylthiotransferase MtaB [Rhodospirillales bacterium]
MAPRRPRADDRPRGDQLHRRHRRNLARESPSMSGPQVVTLGCRLNAFESEIMRELGSEAGMADAIIVNTCAVTAEAERQARQTIRRLRRDNPAARIIVTGCAAQLKPQVFAAMPEVDRVLGNAEKLDLAALADAGEPSGVQVQVADIMAVRETAPHLISGFEDRCRAFVQVQQGCDHRCTFCIIPFARGPNRSVRPEAIVDQVRKLVAGDYREVVLTGVDICSYGRDLPERPSLGQMTGRLLAEVPELRRLRLSTLDPAAIDDDLLELFAEEPRLMPHLHLSLQAMDDMILKRMKRRHSAAQARQVVAKARALRPDAVFGADLIAGFPTETEAMFANTLAAIGELGLAYLHVFPYSPRAGTPAARMPQIAPGVRKARAAKLRGAGDKGLARFLDSRKGTTAEVLVERGRSGLSQHYAPVELDFGAEVGAIVAARVTAVRGGRLIGSRAA